MGTAARGKTLGGAGRTLNRVAEQSLYNPASIRILFNEMARTYGAVNLVSSFGFAVRWRHQCIARLPPTVPLRRVADLMSGMGELWQVNSSR